MVSTHFQNKMSKTAECNELVWEAGRSDKETAKRDLLKVHSLFSGSVALPRIVKNEEDTDVIRKNNSNSNYKSSKVGKGSLGPKYGRI